MKGKAKPASFTQEQLFEVLDYNPVTGDFRWKISPAKNVKAGMLAGSKNDARGYRYVKVLGHEVTTSRLAWFYMRGEWPSRRVKFKNGDPSDASFDNLTLFDGVHGEFDCRTKEGRAAYLRAYRAATPNLQKARALRDSFGISLEEYQRMHDEQDGKCAICGEPEAILRMGKVKALSVDHCHTSGKIRGLLCAECNTGIGKLKEDRRIFLSAVAYLDKHKTE